ncbi:MAG TPA: PASTA domain-containing protein [Armatimonadaceae bacterium]|nr:PASTA domain-containing protein [Armatimonadaceae bacterium]
MNTDLTGTDAEGGEAMPVEAATAAGGAPVRGSGLINRILAGRYEILEGLGEGPILGAYRARDREQNRIVTVKALLPAYHGRPEVAEHLRQGLSQTLSLNQAGIARVFDVGSDPENGAPLFLAEEFVRGIDLRERIRRTSPFSLTAAADVATVLLEALSFAHARGIAHGDVRPQNVLIGGDQQVKLTGFGTAQALGRAIEGDPALGERVAPYTAPEVAGGGAPSPPADLYSIGVLLYEMLTGDLPPRAGIPSPRALNQGVPRALDGIVQKALAGETAGRYASASDMLKDLNAVRDALRYGRSLAWSPLDAAAGGVAAAAASSVMPGTSAASAAAVPPATDPEATVIMPGRRGRTQSVATPPPPSPPVEEKEGGPPVRTPNGSRWLLALNLFLAIVLAGVVGYLIWFTFKAIEPSRAITVPNLVGKTLTQAKQLAQERKFQIDVVDETYHDKKPSGTILQQRPEPGRQILESAKVSLWVSSGPRMVEIPDVRDVSFEKARELLEKAGLRLGERKSEWDPLVSRGNVIQQMPQPGENRPRGTRIDLVLSKGAEPLPTPEPYIEPTPEPIPDEPQPDEPGDAPQTRILSVGYNVPNDAAPHRIRIDVVDIDGIDTVYDEMREPGDKIERDVEGRGKRITIKLYDNDVLVDEKTQ